MSISDQDEFTQDAVVRRAEWLTREGFPKGVIILDDRWQQSYGTFQFDSERFPAPETMIAKLKSLGFDIILTVVPFVSPDSRIVRQQTNNGNIIVGEEGEPAIIKWSNDENFFMVVDILIKLMQVSKNSLQCQMGEIKKGYPTCWTTPDLLFLVLKISGCAPCTREYGYQRGSCHQC